ncbi:MAG TPA: L-lysine 6-transaminase [Chloroflexi bacterium]|nr:MAG: L-lysine 6-transaminase [Chloroflexota bacterium]HDD55497.1 L-lysine 6-transaminase [Chloroflexota bacterium]
MKPVDVHNTIARNMLADGYSILFDLEKSHGVYFVDQITGREYIDFFTFFASNAVGYNHPKFKDPAYLEKLTLSALHKPSNSDIYTTLMAEFVEKFQQVVMPESMPHLFLVSGGALAVENALKTAFDWKVRKNLAQIKSIKESEVGLLHGLGSKVIHFQEAFHGRSGYTLSLTNTSDPRKHMYFPKFDWPRIINPKLRYPVTEDVLDCVKEAEEIAIVQIKTALNQYPGDIAALILEPIQGEGGDNHFRPEFIQRLRALANEHEFLLIFDEIQSGIGITGKMWAYEHYGVEPDIIAFGKKTHVCGIIASKRIDEVDNNVFTESSRINSTFGGNLVDMVRCTKTLEIIEEENLIDNAAVVGEKMINGLESIAAESRDVVSNIRGKGLMVAFDLPDQRQRDVMLDSMFDNGLLAMKSGDHSIRFRGMLDTPEEIINDALEIVAQSIPEK